MLIVTYTKSGYTYPIQFRKKVVLRLEQGMSIRTLADKYDLSPTTIQRWEKRLEPKGDYVRKPFKIADGALRKDVEAYPDDYQYERAQRFNCTGTAIRKALKRLGITQKKTLKHPKADAQSLSRILCIA